MYTYEEMYHDGDDGQYHDDDDDSNDDSDSNDIKSPPGDSGGAGIALGHRRLGSDRHSAGCLSPALKRGATKGDPK